jgi:sugar O-acyltransferase (sialic acid O-acetyltransferase NeuD family)
MMSSATAGRARPPAELLTATVFLFGGGGHGRAVLDVLERRGILLAAVADPTGWNGDGRVAVYRDDDDAIEAARSMGSAAVVAIGDAGPRLALLDRLETAGLLVPPVVAATATVSRRARVGPGTVVLEHAHVGPGASVGRGAIVNTGAVLEHDAVAADGVHVGPRATLAGAARCDESVFVGAGAVVLPGVTIGRRARVGAGAVVIADVAAGDTVVGVPARRVRP